jgi:hypothetical protein
MIMIANDYAGTANPLTCTKDAKHFLKLAADCGVTDIVELYDTQAVKARVLQEIENVASRCQAGDYFMFYYSGHGTQVDDLDGDEDDGKDEALCLVNAGGQLNTSTCLTDDDFAACLYEYVAEDVNIIVICDCCHSGTICDFSKSDEWGNHEALSLSGCLDEQTSGDTGHGGILTHSLLLAIQHKLEKGKREFSCAQLYNQVLKQDDSVFDSSQDITIAMSAALSMPQTWRGPWFHQKATWLPGRRGWKVTIGFD